MVLYLMQTLWRESMTTDYKIDLAIIKNFPSPSGALLSECRTYRYALWRTWKGGKGYACFIGLNPSTADETEDDPTIRRCIGYAKAWGYAGLCMLNLFAFRSTAPAQMMVAADPVGPDNDKHLQAYAVGAGVVVAAWGNDGAHLNRHQDVMQLIPGLRCLKVNGSGQPAHPLYQRADLIPIPYPVSA